MTQPYPFPVEDVDPDAERAPDPERDDALAGATVDGTINSAAADREASYDDHGSSSRVANANGTYADDTHTDDTVPGGAAGSSGDADDPATPEVITVDQTDRAAGGA